MVFFINIAKRTEFSIKTDNLPTLMGFEDDIPYIFRHYNEPDWPDWADAQDDPSIRCAQMPFCWFCHAAAHFSHVIRELSSEVCNPR